MKIANAKTKFKYLILLILVLLCATIISLFFLPKDDAKQLNQNSVAANISKENSIYNLIYAKEFTSCGETFGTPSIKDDLVDGYLKEVVAKFQGQDVYFRVMAMPYAVKEEIFDANYTSEKSKEIVKSRMEYIKEIGAMDIIEGNNYFTFYITVNAEMIEKIGKAGGCRLYLASLPRPDGYDAKIPDFVAYSLENIKSGEKLTIKVDIRCPKGAESVSQLFAELNISDEQISDIYYGADFANFTGSFTKEQILSLAANKNVTWIDNVITIYYGTGKDSAISEDNIEIIKVTEDTKIP